MPRRRPRRAPAPAVDTLPEAPSEWRTPEDVLTGWAPPEESRVYAIARDRRSVYVAWTLTPAAVGRALASLDGPAHLVLRVYVGGDDGRPATVLEHPARDWVGERVVTVRVPGARVVATVGFSAPNAFAHLARASAVRLPRGTPGDAPAVFVRRTPAGVEATTHEPQADTAALARFSMSRARPGRRFADLGPLG